MRIRSLGLLVVALAFSLGGTAARAETPSTRPSAPVASPTAKCHHGQCQAIAKSTGEQCKHCVSNPGDLYCWQHK